VNVLKNDEVTITIHNSPLTKQMLHSFHY